MLPKEPFPTGASFSNLVLLSLSHPPPPNLTSSRQLVDGCSHMTTQTVQFASSAPERSCVRSCLFDGWPTACAATNFAGSGSAKAIRLGKLSMARTEGISHFQVRWPTIDRRGRKQASAHAFRRNEIDPERWGSLSRERRLKLCFKFRSETKYGKAIVREESMVDPWCSWYLLSTASRWCPMPAVP